MNPFDCTNIHSYISTMQTLTYSYSYSRSVHDIIQQIPSSVSLNYNDVNFGPVRSHTNWPFFSIWTFSIDHIDRRRNVYGTYNLWTEWATWTADKMVDKLTITQITFSGAVNAVATLRRYNDTKRKEDDANNIAQQLSRWMPFARKMRQDVISWFALVAIIFGLRHTNWWICPLEMPFRWSRW